MKDFLNFTEYVELEYEGKNQCTNLMYLDNQVIKKVDDSSIPLMVKAMGLNDQELIICFDTTECGHAHQQKNHDKNWMKKNWGSSLPAFGLYDDGVESEIAIQDMIEKCIIPEAEENNVLFLTSGLNTCSFAINLDISIERLKKRKPGLRIDLICIQEENWFQNNTRDRPNCFEYKLRNASKVWPNPKESDIYLQNDYEFRWSPHIKIEEKLSWKLLPNATHYIIVNTTQIKKSDDGQFNQLDIEFGHNIFNKLQTRILQHLGPNSGKPLIVIGGNSVSESSIEENTISGNKYILLDTHKPILAESIEHAFQNMSSYERKIQQRTVDEKNDLFNTYHHWTRYFSYFHTIFKKLSKKVDDQVDRNIKLQSLITTRQDIAINTQLVGSDSEDETMLKNQMVKMAKFLSFVNGEEKIREEGFDDLESKIQLDENRLKFVKKVFFNENFYTANVYEIDDIKSKIKRMVNTNKLPRFNSQEELLIIRTVLDHIDVFKQLSDQYKLTSKIFLQINIIEYTLLTGITVVSAMYPDILGNQSKQTIIALSVLTAFFSGLQAYINPVSKWQAFKSAELLIQSELWKFRTRVDEYSVQKTHHSNLISKKLRDVLTEITKNTISKANISEFNYNTIQSRSYVSFYQYQCIEGESIKILPEAKDPITNDEDQFEPLASTMFINVKQKSDLRKKPINNHQSPLNPIEYINFRLIPTINFYQKRMPNQDLTLGTITVFGLIAIAAMTVLAFLGLEMWIPLVAIVISQISQQKEFNGYDKKIMRYNQIVLGLNEKLHWWMSLNKTEKNNRNNISKLVINSELMIIFESKSWLASSQAEKTMNNNTDEKKTTYLNIDGNKNNSLKKEMV